MLRTLAAVVLSLVVVVTEAKPPPWLRRQFAPYWMT